MADVKSKAKQMRAPRAITGSTEQPGVDTSGEELDDEEMARIGAEAGSIQGVGAGPTSAPEEKPFGKKHDQVEVQMPKNPTRTELGKKAAKQTEEEARRAQRKGY